MPRFKCKNCGHAIESERNYSYRASCPICNGRMDKEDIPKHTLEEYKKMIERFTCQWCGIDLSDQPIDCYPHEGGWNVNGFEEKQWLSIQCPGCGYDWSLWKLGVDRLIL